MTGVIVIGSINDDTVCTVERLPRQHEKLRGGAIRNCLGGSAANTALWLSHMGCRVRLVGTVGADEAGRRCLAALEAGDVDCSYVHVDAGAGTGRAVCLSTKGGKRIITTPGPPLVTALRTLGDATRSYRDVLVHVAAPESTALLEQCRVARRGGALLSVEMNGRSMDGLREIADIAFLNHVELERVFGIKWSQLDGEDLPRMLPRADSRLVVTLGRRGAACLEAGGVTRAPAPLVRIVERTGSGDAFNAGFLAELLGGGGVRQCLDRGNATAANALGRIGGQPA